MGCEAPPPQKKVLRTPTNYFHQQQYIICLSAALIERQGLNFYHQLNVTLAQILLRYFLRILL